MSEIATINYVNFILGSSLAGGNDACTVGRYRGIDNAVAPKSTYISDTECLRRSDVMKKEEIPEQTFNSFNITEVYPFRVLNISNPDGEQLETPINVNIQSGNTTGIWTIEVDREFLGSADAKIIIAVDCNIESINSAVANNDVEISYRNDYNDPYTGLFGSNIYIDNLNTIYWENSSTELFGTVSVRCIPKDNPDSNEFITFDFNIYIKQRV